MFYTMCDAPFAGVVSTGLFNKGDFRYPFMVMTYFMQLAMGQSPLQGAQSTIYAATGNNTWLRNIRTGAGC